MIFFMFIFLRCFEYYFAAYQGFGKAVVAFGMFSQYALGAFVLLGNDSAHFLVDDSGALVAVWVGEHAVLPR